MHKEIILRTLNRPEKKDKVMDIHWICDSFGFVSGRDTDRVASHIFTEYLDLLPSQSRITTDILAKELEMTVARINHHVRYLINRGLLYREKRAIHLRGGTLTRAVEEMRKDANRIFDELSLIAKDVDSQVGLKNRK